MRRDYERLPIEDFGRQLITTGDLDPVYIALDKMTMEPEKLARWLLGYWCWYHCGVASWLSEQEGDKFWEGMMRVAENECSPSVAGTDRWPRGSERRHSRGTLAVQMIEDLKTKYWSTGALGFIQYVAGDWDDPRARTFKEISDKVQEHKNFGPWIAFKIADMVERVLDYIVDFDQAGVFMFKDPMRAAEMLFLSRSNLPEGAKPKKDKVVDTVVPYLMGQFNDLTAPPLHDRPIGIQEVETVLCKWKSHMNGHYPVGKDTIEIFEGSEGWGPTSEMFRRCLPEYEWHHD